MSDNTNIHENLMVFATQINTTTQKLSESVIHVLNDINELINTMPAYSVATLLAGIEQLSVDLPKIEDPNKKQQTLGLLSSSSVSYDKLTNKSLPNNSVVGIAQYGAKFPNVVKKYTNLITNPTDNSQLGNVVQELSSMVEKAMNASSTLKQSPISTGSIAD